MKRKTKTKTKPGKARVVVSRPSDRWRGNDELSATTPYGGAVSKFVGRVKKELSRFSW